MSITSDDIPLMHNRDGTWSVQWMHPSVGYERPEYMLLYPTETHRSPLGARNFCYSYCVRLVLDQLDGRSPVLRRVPPMRGQDEYEAYRNRRATALRLQQPYLRARARAKGKGRAPDGPWRRGQRRDEGDPAGPDLEPARRPRAPRPSPDREEGIRVQAELDRMADDANYRRAMRHAEFRGDEMMRRAVLNAWERERMFGPTRPRHEVDQPDEDIPN